MFIVGLGGPSGTGKTTIARQVAAGLAGHTIAMESYYRDQGNLPVADRGKGNFDAPEAIDAVLLVQQVRDCAAGKDIQVPVYDFAEHTRRRGQHELVHSGPILIVEGILVLHWPELRANFNLSVYLDAPDDVCFHRRKVRDIVERQRSSEFIAGQYQTTVRPMAIRYVYPTKQYADLVIEATKPIATVASQLLEHINTATQAQARR